MEMCAQRQNHIVMHGSKAMAMQKKYQIVTCTERMEIVNQPCISEWVIVHGKMWDEEGITACLATIFPRLFQ